MAQVTYRGVSYDTNRAKSQQSNKVELVYRGVKPVSYTHLTLPTIYSV